MRTEALAVLRVLTISRNSIYICWSTLALGLWIQRDIGKSPCEEIEMKTWCPFCLTDPHWEHRKQSSDRTVALWQLLDRSQRKSRKLQSETWRRVRHALIVEESGMYHVIVT